MIAQITTTCYPPDIIKSGGYFYEQYNNFVTNREDAVDPNCKFSSLMSEIFDTLFELLDYKTANELKEKIMVMSGEDVRQHL